MVVKKQEDGWFLIKQMDHAQHCAAIARAWRAGPFGERSVSAALEYAAGYHDLGWTEIDKQPEIDSDGRPRNFTQIDEGRHTEFYSGAVRTIAQTDPYAAYLVSLHASGLYSRRYGWTGLKPVDWTAIGTRGRSLLTSERAFRAELSRSLSPDQLEFETAWRDYMLLETFDYLSLLTCFGFDSEGCGPVPTVDGQWEQISVRRHGSWEVELNPFPFRGRELVVDVSSVYIQRPSFSSNEALQEEVRRATREPRRTVYVASQSSSETGK